MLNLGWVMHQRQRFMTCAFDCLVCRSRENFSVLVEFIRLSPVAPKAECCAQDDGNELKLTDGKTKACQCPFGLTEPAHGSENEAADPIRKWSK